MAAYRARKTAPPRTRRFRPQDFQVRPRRRFDPWPLVLIAVLAAVGWWLWHGMARTRPPYDFALKSTDRAVVSEGYLSSAVLDEGQPVAVGSTLETRNSERTVFSYGPNDSVRLARDTQLTITANEREGRHALLQMSVQRGRLWLVAGRDAEFLVATPLARVAPTGRITEIRVAPEGATTVTAWQGSAEMWPLDHPDHKVLIGDRREASFDAHHTITDPHPVTLTRDDPWLSWNLLETMHRAVHARPEK